MNPSHKKLRHKALMSAMIIESKLRGLRNIFDLLFIHKRKKLTSYFRMCKWATISLKRKHKEKEDQQARNTSFNYVFHLYSHLQSDFLKHFVISCFWVWQPMNRFKTFFKSPKHPCSVKLQMFFILYIRSLTRCIMIYSPSQEWNGNILRWLPARL